MGAGWRWVIWGSWFGSDEVPGPRFYSASSSLDSPPLLTSRVRYLVPSPASASASVTRSESPSFRSELTSSRSSSMVTILPTKEKGFEATLSNTVDHAKRVQLRISTIPEVGNNSYRSREQPESPRPLDYRKTFLLVASLLRGLRLPSSPSLRSRDRPGLAARFLAPSGRSCSAYFVRAGSSGRPLSFPPMSAGRAGRFTPAGRAERFPAAGRASDSRRLDGPTTSQ